MVILKKLNVNINKFVNILVKKKGGSKREASIKVTKDLILIHYKNEITTELFRKVHILNHKKQVDRIILNLENLNIDAKY